MRRQTVLVVDDDQSLRRVMEMQLEDLGCEVLTAASGQEAIEILSANAVAVVLTDLKMPGISGLDLVRTVKKHYPGSLTVVITAYGTIETAVAAMRDGAYDYLTKPLERCPACRGPQTRPGASEIAG